MTIGDHSETDAATLFNSEAEQSVLGALLMDSARTWPMLAGLLRPEHFFEGLHARIFEAAATLAGAGKIASPVTLKNIFEGDGTLEELGGTKYLARLAASAAVPMSVRPHAEIVRDLASRREAIAAAEDFIERASNVTADDQFRPALAAHVEAMQRLFDDGTERRTTQMVAETIQDAVNRLARIRSGEIDSDAIPTGIASIDKHLGGCHPGQLTILAARPSMGKSMLASVIAYNMARRKLGVAFYSLEMTKEQLGQRLISTHLWTPDRAMAVPYDRIYRGDVSDAEMRWIESTRDELRDFPLVIDDAPGLTAAELEARCCMIKAKLEQRGTPLSCVFVDHLHKMNGPKGISPVQKFTEISAAMAEMAKRLNIPVWCLAQLNRSPESRDNKRPQLADLRESGSIEQDADVVLFIYRDDYYLARQRTDGDGAAEVARLRSLRTAEHRMELIIAKQRSGPTGFLDLMCNLPSNVVYDSVDGSDGMELAA